MEPSMMAKPGMQSPIIGRGGVSAPGSWVQNQPPTEQPLTQMEPELPDGIPGADSSKDVGEMAEQSFVEEPWFAKLPPELRKAIRNNSRRRAPRGYEERLKRYFQSVD